MFPASFIDEILEYRQLGAYFNRAVSRAQDVNRKLKFVNSYRDHSLRVIAWFLPIKETYEPNYGSAVELYRASNYYVDAVIDTYQRVERTRKSASWLFGTRVTFLPRLR